MGSVYSTGRHGTISSTQSAAHGWWAQILVMRGGHSGGTRVWVSDALVCSASRERPRFPGARIKE